MTTRFFSSSALLLQTNSEFHSLMATSASFRPFPPAISLSFRPNKILSKALIMSKPPFFSSISIERVPTKVTASSSLDHSDQIQSVENLPPKLQEIVRQFQSVEDSKTKYQQLLFYGKNLAPLEAKFKTKENKVQGCVSQVWVRAFLDPDKRVHFEADSDSSLTKGLAALLVQGLSGQHVSAILTVPPSFITSLGLQQSLTPSRNNGFLNMLKLMQLKAVQLYKEAEESDGSVNSGSSDAINEVESLESSDAGGEIFKKEPGIRIDELNSNVNGSGEEKVTSNVGLGSRGEKIKEILLRELSPTELEVEDVSYQHAGHAGVGRNAEETHFNVKIVSKEFDGKSLVKRHRLVYDMLQNELQTGLHALSIVAKTPSEVDGR